ncbi:MAG: hypothetical protein [Wendovervirus sonii]|uniref:Homing endonuclease n=1 Tax=phage Lak_Megaphage_Sonny TaxID=3109229 RepID=A0ABZ0Z6Z4_9CAUD|nr:MAG: hypothetical protein [phage Lak_Megaphage_Sonny]
MSSKKCYILLGVDKNGKYFGYCEHSFSMGVDAERVRVEYSGNWITIDEYKERYMNEECRAKIKKEHRKAKRYNKLMDFHSEKIMDGYTDPNSLNQKTWFWLREEAIRLNRKHFANCTWKVYRVNSKHCPVIVDMKEAEDMLNKKIPYDKYNMRNHKFMIK